MYFRQCKNIFLKIKVFLLSIVLYVIIQKRKKIEKDGNIFLYIVLDLDVYLIMIIIYIKLDLLERYQMIINIRIILEDKRKIIYNMLY